MATEVEVIKFEGDLSALKKDFKEAEKGFTTLENKGKTTAKNTEQSFSKLGASVKNTLQNLPFGGLISDLENASQLARGLGQGVAGIGSGAQSAGGGIKALTSLISVGLLGALALVITAAASLVAFFKGTDEGAAKLEATFAGLSAGAGFLAGKFTQLGSEIVDAFSKGSIASNILDASWKTLRVTAAVLTLGMSEVAGTLVSESGIVKGMTAAAKRAFDLSLELDAVNDELRVMQVVSRQTELQITALLKQARNRGIAVTERIGLVAQAQELENSNLAKNFELERRKFAIISEQNLGLIENINSNNKQGVAILRNVVLQYRSAQSADELLAIYLKQVKAQEGLLSISDEQAQVQADGLNKIIELDGRSQALTEKYAAIKSGLIEQEITARTEAIKAIERIQEAAAINELKNQDELARETLAIKIRSLNAQKVLLQQYGRDTSAIDLEIATLNKKYLDDLTKAQADSDAKRLASQKARSEAERKLAEDNFNKDVQDIDERAKFQLLNIRNVSKTDKEAKRQELNLSIGVLEQKKILNQEAGKSTLDIELELQAKKKELYNQDADDYADAQAKKKQATLNTIDFISSQTTSLYNGLAQNRQAQSQIDLSETQKLYSDKQKALQAQLNAGTISQEKYNSALTQMQQQQSARESAIKNKQAKADKEAAKFNIIIDTAQAILKAFVAYGPTPAGFLAAALAGGVGAAQYAIVNARPLPKFKDGVIDLKGEGTGTSDSIQARLSKGESVMTAKETDENLGLLWAIRNNKLDSYVDRAWVKPALDKADEIKKTKEQRYNKMMKKAIGRNSEFDTHELEKAIRKNGKVSIANWDEMPIGKGRNIV